MESKKLTRAPALEGVAHSAGLLPMTVSRALNMPQLVRPKTVERMIQTVQTTGYIPSVLAGGLTSRRNKLVAVIVPQVDNNILVGTIQALGDALAARGYHMLLYVASCDQRTKAELISVLLSWRSDGVALTGIQHMPLLKKTILSAAAPVVEIRDLVPMPLDMLIGFPHERVSETIGEYMLEEGYQRPGLLRTDDAHTTLCRQGLCARLAKKGLGDASRVGMPLPASLALGRRGLAELLAVNEFNMIIYSSDTLIQGVIMGAENRRLRILRDLTVIGFDDLDFAANNRPAVTTAGIDCHAIGEWAIMLPVDRIEGGDNNGVIIDIGFQLMAREPAQVCLFRAWCTGWASSEFLSTPRLYPGGRP